MKRIAVVFIYTLVLSVLFAQEKVWTLEECMEYAVEHNSKRIKQEAQNEIYRLNQQEVIGGFFPSLNAGVNASFNYGRGLDPETNTYINNNTFSNGYEIYSSVTLFNGFARINSTKVARLNRMRGVEQLQETKDMIAYETMSIYFNVLYYKGTVDLAAQQLEESTKNLKRIMRMEELGLKSMPDIAEIQAKEAEDRYLLTKQKNLLELEIIRLKEQMNFPVDEEFSVDDYDAELLISNSRENPFEVYQQAITSLPKLRASEKALGATELEYKKSKAYALPSLSLNGGYSTGFSRMMDNSAYPTFEEQLKNRQGAYISMSLNIPIFNGLSRSSEIKRSKQRLVIARSECEELLRQVYSEIEQVVADVNGLSDEYYHARKRTVAMEAAHKVNLRKYEEGLINAIELTTSSNRLLQSRIEELYTGLKYQLKYHLMEYYKGVPILN